MQRSTVALMVFSLTFGAAVASGVTPTEGHDILLAAEANPEADGLVVNVSMPEDGTVQLAAIREDPVVGPVVDRVVRFTTEADQIVNLTLDGQKQDGTVEVLLVPGDEVLPKRNELVSIVDAERLRELPVLEQTRVESERPLIPSRAMVDEHVVTDRWVESPMLLVTQSGAVVLGYVTERPLYPSEPGYDGEYEQTTVAGPLFARISYDGGRGFGPEIFIGPAEGYPRGHWSMIEVEKDKVLFVLDSPADDAFVESRTLDVASGGLGAPVFHGIPGSTQPAPMSLTPSLARTMNGTVLLGTSVDHRPSIWSISPEGALDPYLVIEDIPGVDVQIASGEAGEAMVWRGVMRGQGSPAIHHARVYASGQDVQYMGPVQPITRMMEEKQAQAVWGPTPPRMDTTGTLHFIFGFFFEAEGEDGDQLQMDTYYVRLPPTGDVLLKKLNVPSLVSQEEPVVLRSAVEVEGSRVWLLYSPGWMGRTFFIESIDSGNTFTAPIELVTPRGQLFYGSGTATMDRPMALMPDGRPLMVSNWYEPGPVREEAAWVLPLFDPMRPPVLTGHKEILPVRFEASVEGPGGTTDSVPLTPREESVESEGASMDARTETTGPDEGADSEENTETERALEVSAAPMLVVVVGVGTFLLASRGRRDAGTGER